MRRLIRDSAGGVSIMGAFALVGLIGSMGFVVDLTAAYTAKIRNQRVSDMAALSAAQVLNDTGQESAMKAAAENVVAAAGLRAPVVATKLRSYNEVQVTVTTTDSAYFTRIFGAKTLDVSGRSVARFGTIVPACMVALAEGATDGILATGGTQLSASGCAVASNSRVRATEGAQLTAMSFTTPDGTVVDCSVNKQCGSKITTAPQINQFSSGAAVDPLANNAALAQIFSDMANGNHPAFPSINTGTPLDFNKEPYRSQGWYWGRNVSHSGYEAKWSNNTYTFPPGNYEISDLVVPGGMTFDFQGPTKVTVSGNVTVGGALKIGDGDVVIKGNLNVSGGTTVTMGAGSHALGGIQVGGGSTLRLGSGSLHVNGNVRTEGGTTLALGAASNHFIKGNMDLSGNADLGQGRYTIAGNFSNSTGGTIQGSNINVIAGGTLTLGGGASINMSAPTIDGNGLIADLLFASRTATKTTIGQGAHNRYKGAIYVPNSEVEIEGGASLSPNSGCFMLIGGVIKLKGGATVTTACPNISAGSSGVLVALIE